MSLTTALTQLEMKETKEKVYQHHITATEKAVSVLEDSFEAEGLDPSTTYVRVGAKPGGCSGWTFLIETTDKKESKDAMYCFGNITFIIDNVQLHTVIGSLEVDYNDNNLVEQGFMFKRLGSGQMCGCGESFTPLGSNKALGW
jgi:iron-sulfur cluster assembly protein